MKNLNYCFAGLFGLIGIAALYGAIFAGATWHYKTFGLCAFLVCILIADIRNENRFSKKQKLNG